MIELSKPIEDMTLEEIEATLKEIARLQTVLLKRQYATLPPVLGVQVIETVRIADKPG